MLQDCLVESRLSKRTKKPFTVLLSIVTHCGIVAALILIPLFQDQVLPQIRSAAQLQPPVTRAVRLVPVAPRGESAPQIPRSPELISPTAIPSRIAVVIDEAPDSGFLPIGNTGVGTNSPFNIFTTVGEPFRAVPPPPPPPSPVVATPPPPPPIPAPAPPPAQIRRGGEVVRSNLIYQVTPAYPPLARQIRLEGTVSLEAVITREGAIDSLRVISGHPLLVGAAVEAVKQWRYRPTLLNGTPVEIITTVEVNFRLN